MVKYFIKGTSLILVLNLVNGLSINNQADGFSSQKIVTTTSSEMSQTIKSNGSNGINIESFESNKILGNGINNKGKSFNNVIGRNSTLQYETSVTSRSNNEKRLNIGSSLGVSPGLSHEPSSPTKIVGLEVSPDSLVDLGLSPDSIASLARNTLSISPKSIPSKTLSVSSNKDMGLNSAPPSRYSVIGSAPSSYEKLDYAKMLQMVNDVRKKAGVGPLKYNDKLKKAAQAHSQDQSNMKNMDHIGSDGSEVGQRVTSAGYKWSEVSENIAWNQASVEEVMKNWIASPGHYKDLIGKDYTDFGCGMINLYWTQVFASPESSY